MANARDPAPLPDIGAAVREPDSILGDFTGHRERRTASGPSRSPARAAGASSPLSTARELVSEAALAARENPQSLGPFTVRLPIELRNAVQQRVITDAQAVVGSGARGQLPAAGHYVDAALRAIPEDPQEAAQWAREWREAHRNQAQSAPAPVGSRVRLGTGAAMNMLSKRLKLVPGRVLAQEVHAAAIARLLARLDAEDGQE